MCILVCTQLSYVNTQKCMTCTYGHMYRCTYLHANLCLEVRIDLLSEQLNLAHLTVWTSLAAHHDVEQDTLSETVVILRTVTVVTFVTWLTSKTEFSSSKLHLQRNFCWRSVLRGSDGEKKLSRWLSIQARLYQIIVRSVLSVSFPSCGAPLVLTWTLASRSD